MFVADFSMVRQARLTLLLLLKKFIGLLLLYRKLDEDIKKNLKLKKIV